MSSNKVKILFIGGLGFIGLNFCLRFQNHFDITIVDAQVEGTGYRERHIELLPKCNIVLGDYAKLENLGTLVNQATHVFLFAGPGAHLAAEKDPMSDIEENINKTVLKTIDILGRNTDYNSNKLLIDIFDDGSSQKRIIIE